MYKGKHWSSFSTDLWLGGCCSDWSFLTSTVSRRGPSTGHVTLTCMTLTRVTLTYKMPNVVDCTVVIIISVYVFSVSITSNPHVTTTGTATPVIVMSSMLKNIQTLITLWHRTDLTAYNKHWRNRQHLSHSKYVTRWYFDSPVIITHWNIWPSINNQSVRFIVLNHIICTLET